MEKLKIIHVIYAGLGGHANVLFPLLETDFGHKFDNEIVFYGIEPTLESYKKKAEALKIPHASIQKKRGQYRKPFKKFGLLLKYSQPDRIIVHSSELILPAIAFRKQKKACAVYYVEHEANASKGISLRFLSNYALKRANAIVCLSEKYRRELENQYNVKRPITVIPNGINTSLFSPVEKHDLDYVYLGMASRMVKGKDHKTLLTAFKIVLENHPNIRLILAGDGETRPVVEALCQQLDLSKHVDFTGMLDEKEMLEFYAKITVYVLATHYETMSTALLQAMSCGLPVVTSAIENNAALIDHDVTGWLYKDENAVDLANQIMDIIQHVEKKNQISAAARAHIIKNFSVQKMETLYTNLVNE